MKLYDEMGRAHDGILELKSPDGALRILYPADIREKITEIGQQLAEHVRAGSYEGETNTKPDTWISEGARLAGIAGKVTGTDPEIDLFRYLPLTKAGRFPKGRSVLVASTKCSTGGQYDGYVTAQRLQLKLVPCYPDTREWLAGNTVPDAMLLSAGLFDAAKKQAAIFDYDGNASKPDTTPAKYLKDSEVKQGWIYEEKSGTKYLCLTGADILCTTYVYQDGEKPRDYESRLGDDRHAYLRWSAALESRLAGNESLANIIADFAAREKDSIEDIFNHLSLRENPRKFVKAVRKAYDPKDQARAEFDGRRKNYYDRGTSMTHYVINGGEAAREGG